MRSSCTQADRTTSGSEPLVRLRRERAGLRDAAFEKRVIEFGQTFAHQDATSHDAPGPREREEGDPDEVSRAGLQ